MNPLITKDSGQILSLFDRAFYFEFDLNNNCGAIFVPFEENNEKYRHVYDINLNAGVISVSTWHDVNDNNSERIRDKCFRFDIEDSKAKNKVRKFLKDYCLANYGYPKQIISKL